MKNKIKTKLTNNNGEKCSRRLSYFFAHIFLNVFEFFFPIDDGKKMLNIVYL